MTTNSAVGRRMAVLAGLVLLGDGARGAELQPLPMADSTNMAGEFGEDCKVVQNDTSAKARLVVRDTLRVVGNYLVSMPGYAAAESPADHVDPYGPYEIHVKPGQTLRIDLDNALTDAEKIPAPNFDGNVDKNVNGKVANLHTHGLIVQPRRYGPCGHLGDYIFDQIDWKATAHYQIKVPETVAGAYLNAPPTDPDHDADKGPYPAGPYWIHSHIHGQAKFSVLAGQSAFLSVDCPDGVDTKHCPNGAEALGVRPEDVKVLALRDVQLLAKQPPDAVAPPDLEKLKTIDPKDLKAQATALFGPDIGYSPTACVAGGGQLTFGPGFCYATSPTLAADKFPGGAASDPAYTAWLFTVSGQLYPDITFNSASSKQLWRIANMSAVVTYRLKLVDGGGKTAKLMKVVSVDGVLAGAGAVGPLPTNLPTGFAASELLLTPGARAEVLVEWTAPEKDADLRLVTAGFCTGYDALHNCTADPWPGIALAHVVEKAAPQVFAHRLTTSAAEASSFFRKRSSPTKERPSAPANCLKLPALGFRTIRFEQDQANFFIGPLNTDAGAEIDRLAEVRSFRHEPSPGMRPHICVEKGQVEMWVLENDTDELHNFHIHQSKFCLAASDELPDSFKAAGPVQDPSGILDQSEGLQAALKAESETMGAVWHDSIPVPPRLKNKDGSTTYGRTIVVIPFTDDNQVGTFVYHCHILEHEDGGMMGVVEVYQKGQIDSGALEPHKNRATAAGFCGAPPPGWAPPTSPGWRNVLKTAFGG